jgi:hypothetical protein
MALSILGSLMLMQFSHSDSTSCEIKESISQLDYSASNYIEGLQLKTGSELLFHNIIAQRSPCRCTVKHPFNDPLAAVDFYIKIRKFLYGDI